jgi:alpha-galactosidase
MKYEGNKVKDLKMAYIGGGSRGWAWGFMMDLALDPQLSGSVHLYDIDRNAAENNAVIGNKITAHPDAKAHWDYKVADSLKDALTGANFVVISILPGTFEEMRSDVHTPEQYGIYQSVGDTVGPGGLLRALRTIPMYVEIAQAIKDYSPNAWVINYTNPMSLCVRTLYEIFPDVKAFGCCHEVFGTQKLLAAMLDDLCGIQDVTRQEIKVNVLGINHFTWFDRATYQGMDLFPLFQQFADKYYEAGFWKGQDDNWMNNNFACGHRVKFDLFRKYGLIAAAGDRHLAEFMPPWYLKNPETVSSWQFALTPVSWRIDDLHKRLDRSRKLVSGEEPLELKASGEEGHLLMKALLGLNDMISNVNIPNRGQIPNLPLGAVVETNALFRRNEIAPVSAGELPGNLLAMVARHVYNQENTLKAVLNYDYNLAFTTFMNDPQVIIDAEDGKKLFDAMLGNTKAYLSDKWFAK